MSDPVDDFLDKLFTRLAPLGARGRRAYLEAETHLLEAAEARRTAGDTDDRAQQIALERFGRLDDYVSEVTAATRLTPRQLAARLVADGWLLGAIAAGFVGLSGVALAVVRGVAGPALVASDPPGTVYSPERCAQLAGFFPDAASCLEASQLHHADEIIGSSLDLGVLGLVALVANWLARRGRLGPLARLAAAAQPALVALVGAVGAATVAAYELLQGSSQLALGLHNGVATSLCVGVAAALATAVLAPRALGFIRA